MDDVIVRLARPEDLDLVGELRWRWEEERHGTPTVPRDEFVPRFTAWARENGSSHRGTVVVRDGVVIGVERVTVHSSERAIPAYTRRGFATSPRLLQVDLATLR